MVEVGGRGKPLSLLIKRPDAGLYLVGIERGLILTNIAPRPGALQFQRFERLIDIGIEFFVGDRPAGMLNPVSLDEVDGVQRDAPPAPDRRGAAKKAQTTVAKRVVVLTQIGAVRQ